MVPWEVQRRTLYLPFAPAEGGGYETPTLCGTGTPHGSDMPAQY